MSIYVYLCDPDQDFTELDQPLLINLLELIVDHKEGCVASASLVVPVNELMPQVGWAYIATDDTGVLEPIFKGHFTGMSKKLNETQKVIELIATPVNLNQQVEVLVYNMKQVHSECLLLNKHKSMDPADYLEFRQELFCYDRLSHKLSLSSLFQGKTHQTFKDQILNGSLNFHITDTPLPGIHVSLTCEWVQEQRGEVNLMPKIELQFPQGRINTLSYKALVNSWPQTGQLLGRSGYSVVRSSLVEFKPSRTGVLAHYPVITPPIHGKTYQSYWMQGTLTLEWMCQQRRRETLEVIIHHKNHYLGLSKRPMRKIKLNLNRLPDSSGAESRFFDTDAGTDAIKGAIKIAQSHLAYSSRAAQLRFEISFKDALELTLDHQITVQHPSLPGGCLSGKLIQYRLERRFDRSTAQLTIAVATGVGELAGDTLSWQESDPVSDITSGLTTDSFIESLTVHNSAKDQIQWLQGQDGVSQVLPADMTTRIEFKLKDLRSQDVVQRRLRLNDLHWSAPNQLSQSEEVI